MTERDFAKMFICGPWIMSTCVGVDLARHKVTVSAILRIGRASLNNLIRNKKRRDLKRSLQFVLPAGLAVQIIHLNLWKDGQSVNSFLRQISVLGKEKSRAIRRGSLTGRKSIHAKLARIEQDWQKKVKNVC